MQGPSNSGVTAFGNSGLLAGVGELDAGLGPSQPQMTSPVVAKKGRTNTPWTPAEEQRLKTLRDAGSSWSEIAKTFPARTEGSVKKHWYKVRAKILFDIVTVDATLIIEHRICIMRSSRKMRSAASFASPRPS